MARQFHHMMANQQEEYLSSVSWTSSASTWYSDSETQTHQSGASSYAPSKTFTIADEKTKSILEMLRKSIHQDEMNLKDNNKVDNEAQASIVEKVIQENRRRSEMAQEEEDELASDPIDRQDEIRLARLEETRPRWLTFSLKFFFHLMVFANFFTSWYDSARLLLEDAKMNLWLLEDDYNCLNIVSNVDVIDHSINIFHALLSCSVLYVHKRNSAKLCLAWIASQAIHSIFKMFQYFYNLKFERKVFGKMSDFSHLIFVILFNAFGSLLLLHKYYDLTDRFRTRAKYFGTTDTDERSLNDKIIYKNETSFLQRKNILREVTIAQTYAIIQKIGKHAKQGLHVDPLSLDREVNAAKLALADCADADNHAMMYMLKKAYAHRLKELEDEQEKVLFRMAGGGGSTKNSESNRLLIHSETLLNS